MIPAASILPTQGIQNAAAYSRGYKASLVKHIAGEEKIDVGKLTPTDIEIKRKIAEAD